VQHPRQLAHILDEVVVLGARARDAGGSPPESIVPIRCVGTWPFRQTIGPNPSERRWSPVTAFVAHGPLVTSTTPTRPVERA